MNVVNNYGSECILVYDVGKARATIKCICKTVAQETPERNMKASMQVHSRCCVILRPVPSTYRILSSRKRSASPRGFLLPRPKALLISARRSNRITNNSRLWTWAPAGLWGSVVPEYSSSGGLIFGFTFSE